MKCKGLVLKEKIPFKPILRDPVKRLYFVCPSFDLLCQILLFYF